MFGVKILQYLQKNPDKRKLAAALAVSGAACLGAGLYGLDRKLKKRAAVSLLDPVVEKLEKGTKPSIRLNYMVERREIWEAIERTFITGTGREIGGFGIIFGPSGSGKTIATRKVCNDHPKGVIYVELKGLKGDYSFVSAMINQMGLKVKPTGIVDLFLGYLSSTYISHHQLPGDPWASMDYIFEILIRASEIYKLKHHQMPVMFIDGCDALAKDNPKGFERLVYLAKVLINDKTLRVVFVSSEGSIIPEIQKSSAINRCSAIQEIGDITDEEALNYVCCGDVPVNIAKGIVKMFGGRFVYLNSAIRNYHSDIAASGEIGSLELITRDIVNFKTKPQLEKLIEHEEMGKIILQCLCTKGYINIDDFKMKGWDIKEIKGVIRDLLSVNLLRYNRNLDLTWHSRIEENFFRKGQ